MRTTQHGLPHVGERGAIPLSTGRARWIIAALTLVAVGVVMAKVVGNSGGRREVTLPAGTQLVAALQNTVSTENSDPGRRIELITVQPVKLSEQAIVPAGMVVEGEVTHAKGGGRIAGAPELTLRFTRLVSDGESYPIVAEPFRVRGKDDALESAAEIGGGAVVGGVVGAIAGSTVKGAVVGAILGTGVAVATKGNQIVLPTGQRLRIRLSEPVRVSYKPEPTKQ